MSKADIDYFLLVYAFISQSRWDSVPMSQAGMDYFLLVYAFISQSRWDSVPMSQAGMDYFMYVYASISKRAWDSLPTAVVFTPDIPISLSITGNVVRVDIAEDQDKKSKGFGTVVFETPGEALSAVCILSQSSSSSLGAALFKICSQTAFNSDRPHRNNAPPR